MPTTFLPLMGLAGGNVASFGTTATVTMGADTAIQAGDTLIWSKGNHNMKFGFQAFRFWQNIFYSGNNGEAGSFLFNGQYTAGPVAGTKAGTVNSSGTASGIAEADFVLGLPNEVLGGVNGGTWGQRNSLFAAFVQDDWRVTPNLTINLGLRWELVTPLTEVRNRQANFDLTTGQAIHFRSKLSFKQLQCALQPIQRTGQFSAAPGPGLVTQAANLWYAPHTLCRVSWRALEPTCACL